jgi:hypothetical protein
MTKPQSLDKYFLATVLSSQHLFQLDYKHILIWGAVLSLLASPSLASFMTARAQSTEITLTAIAAEPKERL